MVDIDKDKIKYIITDGWAGRFAWPCIIISSKEKYSIVKLIFGLNVNNKIYKANTIKTRIPNKSISNIIGNATEITKEI